MLIDVKNRGSIKNSIHFQSNLLATVVTSVILVLFVKVYSRPLLKIHSLSPESRKQIEIKWSLEPPELNTKELKKFVEANLTVQPTRLIKLKIFLSRSTGSST